MKSIKNELRFIIALLKSEKSIKQLRRGWQKDYFRRVLGVYLLLDLILAIVLIIPLGYAFEEYFETYQEFMESPFEIIMLGVLIVPFIEELIFRWPLVYNESHIKLFLFGVSLLFLLFFWQVGIILLIATFILSSMKWDKFKRFKPRELHKKYIGLLFWLSVIAFGLIHITNYDFKEIPFYVYPFMVLPQIIGGISLAIIRIKFGLRYAIIQHSLFNLIAFSSEIFFS